MSITVLIEEHLSKPIQFGKPSKLIGLDMCHQWQGGQPGPGPVSIAEAPVGAAEIQVVVLWAGLHRLSISALRAPLKYLGPVSRAASPRRSTIILLFNKYRHCTAILLFDHSFVES